MNEVSLSVNVSMHFYHGPSLLLDGDFTASLILTFDTGSGPGISSSAQVTILRDLLVEEENETLILQLTTMPLARLAFPVGEDLVEGTIMDVDGNEQKCVYCTLVHNNAINYNPGMKTNNFTNM